MGTIIAFRLLVLDLLKYSSKAESPIYTSTKAVISRNFAASQRNHLFIFSVLFLLFMFLLFFIYVFSSILFWFFISFFILFTENRRYRLICIAITTVFIGLSEWMYICMYTYIYGKFYTKYHNFFFTPLNLSTCP